MKKLIVLLLLLPSIAWASVSGMDDRKPNITPQTQALLDETLTTYYQQPAVAKVNTILDIMNDSSLLRKKTSWSPMIGFLSVVFADNKQHIFSWMSRNDYNTYAQYVFVTALLHAKLKEAALVFAQAHQWKKGELNQLYNANDNIDYKHLKVILPGHIDTLWGAFFASGDPVYVNEIIDVLFEDKLPNTTLELPDNKDSVLPENKKLAESTLRQYATRHKPVRDALKGRIASEENPDHKRLLGALLASAEGNRSASPAASERQATMSLAAFAGFVAALGVLMAGICGILKKRKT